MFNLIRLTVRRARQERLPQVAGSLTFTTLLAAVPLLAVGFALFTRASRCSAASRRRARKIPARKPAAGDIARTVLRIAAPVRRQRRRADLDGSLVLRWAPPSPRC